MAGTVQDMVRDIHEGAVTIQAQTADGSVSQTRENVIFREITLSLDTVAYAAGDVLADTQEIATAMRANGATGEVDTITVIDKDDQSQGLDLIFLETNVSLGTENSAPTISDADAEEILGQVQVAAGDYTDLGGVAVATKGNLGIRVKSAAASQSIFVGAISQGTGTYTASGIVIKIVIRQD